MNQLNESTKVVIDIISMVVAVGTFLTQILPALASLASLVWACIRIYEWWKEKKLGNKRLD